jgi:zinc transporter
MNQQAGLINAFVLDGEGGGTALDWAGVRGWTAAQGVLWVHLDFTAAEAQDWLFEQSGLEPLVAEALAADETRPRCVGVAEGLLISLRGVNNNPRAEPEDMVSIRLFCTGERIISTRRRRLLTIRDLAEALERGDGPRDSGELTAMLADRLIERMGRVIGELDERTDDLEEAIIKQTPVQEIRSGLLELRREIIELRRYLAPQREALSRLTLEKVPWIDSHDRLQIREAYDTLTRYVEDLDAVRERAGVAYEELASRQAEQMNARMYLLSLIAGLFLPLGFLTGLLGINVGGIPLANSHWGFFIVVAFLVVLILAQVLIFRRKHWF